MEDDCCRDSPLYQEASRRGVSHECWEAGPTGSCCQSCHDTILLVIAEMTEGVRVQFIPISLN